MPVDAGEGGDASLVGLARFDRDHLYRDMIGSCLDMGLELLTMMSRSPQNTRSSTMRSLPEAICSCE
ncbi:hypothetical protein ABZZ74_47290 [Streptomyces sp. NPDC006476]|uniref:hypothetical protein n=1 Tax=Streptomyces sp. NPDC006476 TaxID=3157175 RepID=UPI0033B99256